MPRKSGVALGLDFGTETVRVLLVDLSGREWASAVARYRHGQIVRTLPCSDQPLPPDYALQHPLDWLAASEKAVRRAVREAGVDPDEVVGIGVDFTSCTMLPARRDGTPLCLVRPFATEPHAWPKLWKHHGAKSQTERFNVVARRRNEPLLRRYGSTIGLEWFFPKILEVLEEAPSVFEAAEVWLEAGDWYVWQLVGGEAVELPRSTCQAGYKALWSAAEGYPSEEFLRAVHPRLSLVVRDRLPGRLLAPGQPAGVLDETMARRLGLRPGIPVSAAVIDAHAGVPGAGADQPGVLVLVLGTSSCHLINALDERLIPGVAGVVKGGILPGYFGYETGQAAVGDAFDWLRQLTGQRNLDHLGREAASLPPGAEGVHCLDWFNGCRTPLMDGSLTGALLGLKLHHTPAHLYRAILEATAYGLRWIVELLEEHGVPVRKLVATGGLPHHNPLVVQVYADVLGRPITVHPCKHGPALGAAILGALAAGSEITGFSSPAAAIRAMARGTTPAPTIKPQRGHQAAYDPLYRRYRDLADYFSRTEGSHA